MTKFIIMLTLASVAVAQQFPSAAPPCTATRTANCSPKTDASGNLSVGSTVTDPVTGMTGPATGAWHRQGIAILPVYTTDQNTVQEPQPLYDSSPQILTNALGNVFKLWFSCGNPTFAICYAESVDGINFTRLSAPVVGGNHAHSHVFKVANTYYMYATHVGPNVIDRLTSSDGITWTTTHTGVIAPGSSGAWDSQNLFNPCVFIDGGVWKMVYEGSNGAMDQIGLATSSDGGITWTKYSGNPVLTGTGTHSHADLHKVGSQWYAWIHGTGSVAGLIPTDIYFYTVSSDFLTWTLAVPNAILQRATADELGSAQVADPRIIEAQGRTYIYFSNGQNRIRVATYDGPLANIAVGQVQSSIGTWADAGWIGTRAYRSTSLGVLHGGWSSPIPFDLERYNFGGIHNIAVNSQRFTAPVSGVYQMSAHVQFQADDRGWRALGIYDAACDCHIAETSEIPGNLVSGDSTTLSVSTSWYMTAGDYVQVVARQVSANGVSLNLLVTGDTSIEFAIHRVGP